MTNKNTQRLLLTTLSIAIIAAVFTPTNAEAEIPFSNLEEKKIWMYKLMAEKHALKAEAVENNAFLSSLPGGDASMSPPTSINPRIQEINAEFARVSEELRALDDITPQEKAKLDEALLKVVKIHWIPFVAVSVDVPNKVIDITMHDIARSNEFHITQYLKKTIDVPFVLSYGPYAKLDLCDTHKSDCDPVIGGIEFHTRKGDCTIGLPVQMNHPDGLKTGFITAGHCVNEGNSFQQPSDSTTNDGTVIKVVNKWECDCAFVETTSNDFDSTVMTSNGTYAITNKANPMLHDIVSMQGRTSGERIGEVVSTSTHVWPNFFYYFNDAIKIDSFVSQGGDSGAPIIDTDGSHTFHGTVSAHTSEHTYAMKWTNIEKYLNVQ